MDETRRQQITEARFARWTQDCAALDALAVETVQALLAAEGPAIPRDTLRTCPILARRTHHIDQGLPVGLLLDPIARRHGKIQPRRRPAAHHTALVHQVGTSAGIAALCTSSTANADTHRPNLVSSCFSRDDQLNFPSTLTTSPASSVAAADSA